MKRASKYKSIKVTVDGIVFDSKREAKRYGALKIMEKAGLITELETQPVYRLEVNGKLVCKYIADFRYFDKAKQTFVTEDVKSAFTAKLPVYRIKNKLMKAIHNIDIQEIY